MNKIFKIITFSLLCSLSVSSKKAPTKQYAVFAGGCFWCMEKPFEILKGVKAVHSGYAGGKIKYPTYKQVAGNKTEHVEAVRITYNPKLISYEELLEVYFRQVDPTDSKGQFVDRGPQYRPVIFTLNQKQKKSTLQAIKILRKYKIFPKPINLEVRSYKNFYAAEDYHQDFYKKNPKRYYGYRSKSGRDRYINKIWKNNPFRIFSNDGSQSKKKTFTKKSAFVKPSLKTLKKTLTPMQFKVTQKDGTEPAFRNLYWDSKKQGIYVDIVSGEALFSSTDKFKSGTGWPSFTKPIQKSSITYHEDRSLFSLSLIHI